MARGWPLLILLILLQSCGITLQVEKKAHRPDFYINLSSPSSPLSEQPDKETDTTFYDDAPIEAIPTATLKNGKEALTPQQKAPEAHIKKEVKQLALINNQPPQKIFS